MFILYIMNTDKYNNNPDAKNYSNCDISGSFYEVGVAKKESKEQEQDKEQKEQTQEQTTTTACACVGTCAKKS